MERRQQHFLVVTYPVQSHINPALHLAKRLARTTGALVTFSTAVSAHRRMFPSVSPPDQPVHDGLISYIPFSDGYDDGFKQGVDDATDHFISQFKRLGFQTLSNVAGSLAARGRPVTCVIYTFLLAWAVDLARDLRIPSALYWIQPATVFAIYYHYYHGYDDLISAHCNDPLFTVNLPGLPPLRIRDLPSFLTLSTDDHPYSHILSHFRALFENLDKEEEIGVRLKVLVNTFDTLEADALAAINKMDQIPVGPMLPPSMIDGSDPTEGPSGGDMFKPDGKEYMEWLDSKPERSVVYVSFGSISTLNKRQVEEISQGLAESGRPYLWVLRKDSRWEGVDLEGGESEGMVVEWCSQVRVLSHRAIGCFVTHCGWNSTVESLACGVPTVGVPQWSDQGTNAWLAEEVWGTGVRGELDGDGLFRAKELIRCLEVVMGDGERGVAIKRKAELWRDRAGEAVREGGSSDRNLKAFVEEIALC